MKPDDRGAPNPRHPFRLRSTVLGVSVAAGLGGGAFLLVDPAGNVHPLLAAAFILAGLLLAASGIAAIPRAAILRAAVAGKLAAAAALILQLTDWPVLPADVTAFLARHHHASDLTVTLAFGCIALALILQHAVSPRPRGWIILPLLPVFWISYLSLAAAFYGVESLNPYFAVTLVPVPVALLLAFLIAGMLALDPSRGFMGVVTSRHVGGLVARIALPALLIIPFTVGWVRFNAVRSGSFDDASAFSQFAASNVVSFGFFIWFCAHYLNRIDARRQKAMTSLQGTNLELQRVNRELEARIADHTRAEAARRETERELFESRKLEAVGTLASGIAHDFNNLLTVILLSAEDALEAAPAEGSLRENLLEIRRSGGRAAEVVRQIMAFARKAPGRRDSVDPGAAVRETAVMLQRMLDPRIDLRLDIAADLPPVPADPTQMQQVLLNLGTNAAHAMAENGGILTISVRPGGAGTNEDFPAPHVRITVSDTGHGIDPGTLARIFDPFFTTKPPGKGTGLGLSVADGILRAHGGAIRVASETGRGTAFDLYFPVALETNTQ